MTKTENETRKGIAQNETNAMLRINQILDALCLALFANPLVKIYCNSVEVQPFSMLLLKQIDEIIAKHLTQMAVVVSKFTVQSWRNGEALGYAALQGKVPDEILKTALDKGLFAHREDAMQKFVNRKIKGLKLSDRVWRLQPEIRTQIEQTLQVGISEGRSAIEISHDLRRYLNEPSRLFRRVRDAEGKLHLSKAAKAYHPGTGVNRSSAKNAERLARNEINKAYRTAHWESMQRLDFVLGIEIRRSNNLSFDCPRCDGLAGRYPKGFRWSGWHVSCRCHMISVLPNPEEFLKHQNSNEPYKQIDTYPASMAKYATKNKHRYKPDTADWIDDNPEVLNLFK